MGEWEDEDRFQNPVRRGRTNATRKADDRTTAQRDHVGNVERPTRAKKKKTPTTTTTRDGALRKSKHSRHPGTSCPVRTSFRPPPTCPSDGGDRPPPPSSFRSPIGAARPWCGKCSLFVSKIYKYLASGFRRLRIGDWERGYFLEEQTNNYLPLYVVKNESVYEVLFSLTSNQERRIKSPTGPRLLLDSTALHCSAGCQPPPTTTQERY